MTAVTARTPKYRAAGQDLGERERSFTVERRTDERGTTVEWVYYRGMLVQKRTIPPVDAAPAARRIVNTTR